LLVGCVLLGGLLSGRGSWFEGLVAFGDLLCDCRFLCSGVLYSFGEAFDCAGVEVLLAEVLAGEVDLCLLACAADGDVGVLAVGLPAAGEDARGFGGEALALVDVDGVCEGDL
jgi:hypothetical protein